MTQNLSSKAASTLRSVAKAFLYGLAAAAGLSVFTFLFAFLTGGFSLTTGLDWARKLLYVVGACAIIVSGAGLFFSGSGAAHRDERIGFKKDETLSAFEHIAGLSWPWALLAASAAFILLGFAVDLVALAL